MSHTQTRMGRGMMLRLVMAWRVLEYNYDDTYLYRSSSKGELKKHPFEIEKGWVYGSGRSDIHQTNYQSDISDLIHMMPCYDIMADVSAQS